MLPLLIGRLARYGTVLGAIAVMSACGGGAPGSTTSSGSTGTTGTGTGTGTGTTVTLALAVTLTDSAGTAVSQIVPGTPAIAAATLTRNGAAVAGEVVSFTPGDATLVTMVPSAGTALTDASGVARVTVNATGSTSGATKLTANATVGTGSATATSATGTVSFSVGASAANGLTVTLASVPTATTPTISSYGALSVLATVKQTTGAVPAQPVTVSFTTDCGVGKATITSTVTTLSDGTAPNTFTDKGCASEADKTVKITASIQSGSAQLPVLVKAPTAGSLLFVSASPSDKSITLKGQGGAGRQEFATLTFKVVDLAGNGVPNVPVCFEATTYVGGLNVDGFNNVTPKSNTNVAPCPTTSAVNYTKPTSSDGTITVQVNSGTTPTPVRVAARAIYPVGSANVLTTNSDSLSISTGLPIDRSMDLAVDKANIDGGDFSGETANFTVRLADQFGNPVPDGTVVNFITSGGAVCTSSSGSCTTANGSCSCALISQDRRPADGRVVVMAYTVGQEDFTDANGNNQYDLGEPFIDLGDAYLDGNKNGTFDTPTGSATADQDVPVPYQTPGVFKGTGDGVRGTAHLRRSGVVYFSRSSGNTPTIIIPAGLPFVDYTTKRVLLNANGVALCSDPPSVSLPFALEDGIGNPMAATTTLTAADPSPNVAPGAVFPAAVAAAGARPPVPAIDSPNVAKTSTLISTDPHLLGSGHVVRINGVAQKCSGLGSFGIQIKSPRGAGQFANILFEGEPRSTVRSAITTQYQ